MEVDHKKNSHSWLDTAALWTLMATVFLMPLFVIPSASAPFNFTKTLVLIIGVVLTVIFYTFGRLHTGEISIPNTLLFFFLPLLPLIYFLSGLFSGEFANSFIGDQFETDTVITTTILVVLALVTATVLHMREHILKVYLAIMASGIVLAVFQVLRLLGGSDFITLGIFNNNSVGTLIGQWHDLSMFFGMIAVLALVSLEGLNLSRIGQWLLSVLLAFSVFMLSVANFREVWILLGTFSLGFIVYLLSRDRFAQKHLSFFHRTHSDAKPVWSFAASASVATLLISLVFIVSGNAVGTAVSNVFNIQYAEVRPSWEGTLDIAQGTYGENMLFGSGPHTFVYEWLEYKPDGINQTAFWNTDFISGVGFIPTAVVTTGIVGAVTWLTLFGLLIMTGLRVLLSSTKMSNFDYYLVLSSFTASVYLWTLTILHTPGVVLLMFAFFTTGVFIASIRHATLESEKTFVFSSNPHGGTVVVLSLTALLILGVGTAYVATNRYVAETAFQKSFIALNQDGSLEGSQRYLEDALDAVVTDKYLRGATEVSIARVNEILSQPDLDPASAPALIQQSIALAVQNAIAATNERPQRYQNWLILARVYASVVPLGIDGAYENAVRAYDEAITRNPHNPALMFERAQLEYGASNFEAAREWTQRAIALRRDYTNAIFLLSQIQIQEGEIEEAIESVEATILFDPQNPVNYFQLGVLRYSQEEYDAAITIFERAVSLNEQYANARYFLGLAYYEVGRVRDALLEFETIRDLSPDNAIVEGVIANLRAGREPLAEEGNPLNNTTPPIAEDALVGSVGEQESDFETVVPTGSSEADAADDS